MLKEKRSKEDRDGEEMCECELRNVLYCCRLKAEVVVRWGLVSFFFSVGGSD